MFGLKSEIRKS